jgi:hypothetical protein
MHQLHEWMKHIDKAETEKIDGVYFRVEAIKIVFSINLY